MNLTFRKYQTWIAIFLTAFFCSIPSAFAALKVWSTTETIQAADLNSNFTQINASATALITNSRVSTTAAIATSKLADKALMPKIWGGYNAACDAAAAATCTLVTNQGLTSIIGAGVAGRYIVTFPVRTDNLYGVFVMTKQTNSGCYQLSRATTNVVIQCETYGAAATNSIFDILIMDNT
jgi:hypothetical protein